MHQTVANDRLRIDLPVEEEEEEEGAGEDGDETGVEPKDIELVMTQVMAAAGLKPHKFQHITAQGRASVYAWPLIYRRSTPCYLPGVGRACHPPSLLLSTAWSGGQGTVLGDLKYSVLLGPTWLGLCDL
jgi:hypothetical protein